MKRILIIIFLLNFLQPLAAQPDSACSLRISLLTCSPGQELYSTFGHSALRVSNSSAHTDLVYNYGTFDFDDPDFYSKFVRGKLLYFVSVENFEDFREEYIYERRGIQEQILDMSCADKDTLLKALEENVKDEHKYYKYDFVSDNCTTRLRDIIFKNIGEPTDTKRIADSKTSFRKLIHEYLDRGGQYWSKLGIDILLGAPLDKKLSTNETMFLPDYLLKGLDSTSLSQHELVSRKSVILDSGHFSKTKKTPGPFLIFLVLFGVVSVLSFFRGTRKLLSVFDFFLFFLSGVVGILLLFMWFGTDHPECRYNLNLAWAFPLHFLIVFFIYRRATFLSIYWLANAIILLLLLLSWAWLPQQLNPDLIPLVGLLLLRTLVRYRRSI